MTVMLSITMKLFKTNKHSIRYAATDTDAAISDVYVKNKDIPNLSNPPAEIVVKVEFP